MLGLDLVFHEEAGVLDRDGFGVVKEAVEDSGGEGAVVVEDSGIS